MSWQYEKTNTVSILTFTPYDMFKKNMFGFLCAKSSCEKLLNAVYRLYGTDLTGSQNRLGTQRPCVFCLNAFFSGPTKHWQCLLPRKNFSVLILRIYTALVFPHIYTHVGMSVYCDHDDAQ